MKRENYRQTPRAMSREGDPRPGREEDFIVVDSETINSDPGLRKFLLGARVSVSRRGNGIFISGAYGVDTSELRKYGIPVQGALIVPTATNVEEELSRFSALIQEIKESKRTEYQGLLEKDTEDRRGQERQYSQQVRELLEKAKLKDVDIIVKDGVDLHNVGSTANRTGHLSRGEEVIFDLFREKEPYSSIGGGGNEFKPWRSNFTPIEKVDEFIAEEIRLKPLRERFRERLLKLAEITENWGKGLGEKGFYQNVEFIGYLDDYKTDVNFFGPRRSVDSAHKIIYNRQIFELAETDVARLEQLVGEKMKEIQKRREHILRLFQEAKGVLTRRSFEESLSEVRHSLVSGRVINDSLTRVAYFLGEYELSPEEYDWLKLKELPQVPEGYYRVPNDTNDIRPIIYPRPDNTLEVLGKTGQSVRGKSPTGVLYRGRPEDCNISPKNKWAYRWTLNGQEITVRYEPEDFFRRWNDPARRAQRAFEEAGRKPDQGEVEALVEAYKKGKK